MHNTPAPPADLLRKYNTQVPRYTTYPTAPQFRNDFNGHDFERHSVLSNSSLLPKDLSICVHVPFCHLIGDFNGSNKIMTRADTRKLDNYLERLLSEIAMRGKLFSDDRLVTHIHFSDAIANTLNAEQLASILDQIALQFHLDLPSNLEISIELDPLHTSPLEVKRLAESGINRFIIGVQSFSEKLSKADNREPDEEHTLAVIKSAMHLAKSVNVELITGSPLQNLTNCDEMLSRIINTGVTRVTAYDLADLPKRIGVPQMIDATAPTDTKIRHALSSLVRSKLLDASYTHIGMDYYALPSDSISQAQKRGELRRNFQGYTTHRDNDLIGVGACAISKLDTAFSQNESSLSRYSELIDDNRLPIAKGVELSHDDQIRADVIQQIMCRGGVDLSTKLGQFTESNNTMPLFEYLKRELLDLKSFEQDGLVLFNGQGFEVTETGRYFMRSISAVFDCYLNPIFNKHVLPFTRKLERP